MGEGGIWGQEQELWRLQSQPQALITQRLLVAVLFWGSIPPPSPGLGLFSPCVSLFPAQVWAVWGLGLPHGCLPMGLAALSSGMWSQFQEGLPPCLPKPLTVLPPWVWPS